MNWLEVSVRVHDEETAAAICQLFDQHGQGGAVQERILLDEDEAHCHAPPVITVKTYLPSSPADSDESRHALELGLSHLAKVHSLPPAQFRELEEEDWANAWKAYFQPQRIGRRLVLKLAEQDYYPNEGDIVIDLEPGMAFGTGLHSSTRMCLACLEEYVKAGDTVLDMGTGSGILAISAAMLGAGFILALDNDPIAVQAARGNVCLNGLDNVIQVEQGSLATLSEASYGLLNGITINILADVIANMVEKGLTSHLKPDGWLIAGGIVQESEAMLRAVFKKRGLHVRARSQEDDWVTLCAVKLRSATELQLRQETA